MKLYYIIATSKLGRRVQSGPWSARWICRKALTYESGGFSDVAIVDLGDKQQFTLGVFLAHHPREDDQGGDWRPDA